MQARKCVGGSWTLNGIHAGPPTVLRPWWVLSFRELDLAQSGNDVLIEHLAVLVLRRDRRLDAFSGPSVHAFTQRATVYCGNQPQASNLHAIDDLAQLCCDFRSCRAGEPAPFWGCRSLGPLCALVLVPTLTDRASPLVRLAIGPSFHLALSGFGKQLGVATFANPVHRRSNAASATSASAWSCRFVAPKVPETSSQRTSETSL